MRILILLLLSIVMANAQKTVLYDTATQTLNQTNIFSSNVLAGANVTIVKGPLGQLTVSAAAGGASGTNFNSIFVTNNIFGTNYIYAVDTNKPNGIVSFEWLTNIVKVFESITSNGAVSFTMTASNTLQTTFVANDTITSNGVVALVGETNFNGEVSITNATRVGLVYGKLNITNLLRSLSGGANIVITNEGTNIVIASTASGSGSLLLSNLTTNPYTGYTNQVFGGTNIHVRTVGGTNFIDTIGELNNWALYSTNVIGDTSTNVFNLLITAPSNFLSSIVGETNWNGEVSITNATRIGWVSGKVNNTNLLRSAQAGNGLVLTNQGTNVMFAIDPAVVASQSNLTAASNALAALVGETNWNGEVSITNSTRMGLVYDKVGITNRLRSIQGGNGVILTNQGTNLMLAIDPSVIPGSSAVLSNLSSNPYTGYTNQVFGGSNINVRTIGGTNFIDTTGNLNNWALIPTNFFLYHTNDTLTSWTASQMYQLTALKRDTNSVITNATVLWPDGSAGVFTCTSNNPYWATIDSYTVTYAGLSKTITQSTVIRDNFGAITNKPALVVTP